MKATEGHAGGDSHDEAKEAAEHEEHLTHVHQLQNNMGSWAALVACIFLC
jgi:hypothetical protein